MTAKWHRIIVIVSTALITISQVLALADPAVLGLSEEAAGIITFISAATAAIATTLRQMEDPQ